MFFIASSVVSNNLINLRDRYPSLQRRANLKCGKSKPKAASNDKDPAAASSQNINPSMMTQVGTSQKDVKKDDAGATKSAAAAVAANKSNKQPKSEKKKAEESKKLQAYPSIKEPTASIKKEKAKELEKDKKEKIDKGFYQSKSDVDDTLEKVTSLKPEESDASKRAKSMKSKK